VTRSEKDIAERITDVAIELAEEGGYDNVRQRDVAARANVALGTLYKHFRSKEDILSAAMSREAARLEVRLEKSPPRGDTIAERLGCFFETVTRGLCRRPNYARAVIRAMASGQPEVARHVVAYQGRINRLLIGAMRGATSDAPPTERELTLSVLLQQLWFAALVGWAAGLHSQAAVVDQVARAADLLLAGLAARGQA